MSGSKLERDMSIIQSHWNNFISLIKKDLNKLYEQQKNNMMEIRKMEQIDGILHRGFDNAEFLIIHKDSLLELDESLKKKFLILEEFKKRNNLSNAVAIRTCKEILESEKLKNIGNLLEALRSKRDSIQYDLISLTDLMYGKVYDKELIVQLLDKYDLDNVSRNAILLYPIIKTLKPKEKDDIKAEEVTDVIKPVESAEIVNNDNNSEIEELGDNVQKVSNLKNEYDIVKERYEKAKEKISPLLNKYYVVLSKLKPTEAQYYRVFCNMKDDEIKKSYASQIEGKYDEALSKIRAIKLFDLKFEIENTIKTIIDSNYSDKEAIEYFDVCITDFEKQSEKLIEVDLRITKTAKEIESIKNSKVFFFVDQDMKPLIPDEIRTHKSSLINILEKANDGHIQQKHGSNIMPLKIKNKKFNEEVERTVFSVRNNKIIVSYIKLNSTGGISNDGGIMILTASLLNPNTIQDDTNRVIREYREQIMRQITAIEKGDPHHHGLQELIRKELMKNDEVLEEGDVDGKQVK